MTVTLLPAGLQCPHARAPLTDLCQVPAFALIQVLSTKSTPTGLFGYWVRTELFSESRAGGLLSLDGRAADGIRAGQLKRD